MGFRQMKMQCGSEPTIAASVERVRVMREAHRPRHRPDVRHQPALERAPRHRGRASASRDVPPLLAGGPHRPRRLSPAWPASPTRSTRPIAAGEYHYGIVPFRHLLEARSIDIVMIDLLRVGGITQWMKVAGMAEAFNLPVVSHLIPEIHVHLIAAIPNGLTVEYMPWTLPAVRGDARDRGRQARGAGQARPGPGVRPGGDQALPGRVGGVRPRRSTRAWRSLASARGSGRSPRRGSGPAWSRRAFSCHRSGRLVPTIAVCTPGAASVKRSAVADRALGASRRKS